MTSDVVVIGAGVIGCAVAWRLQRRGLQVTLLDRGRPGQEASSAAAGILAPQAEAERPGPFLDLALASRSLYPAWVAQLQDETGIDVGYRAEGTLVLGGHGGEASPAEIAALRDRFTWQKAAGLPVSWLGREEVRAAEPQLAPCACALHFPDDHQLEAPLLSAALFVAATGAGARFREAAVAALSSDGKRVLGVRLADGEDISCPVVVVAAGAWSALLPGVGLPPRAVRPVRGQMLELLAPPPSLRHVVFGHVRALPGADLTGGYLVPRRGGRVVAGSTMEQVGFRKEVTAGGLLGLLALCAGLSPGLAEAEVRSTWSGFRPFVEDTLPILGQGPLRGLHLCTGHFRNGILLCPISAEAICQGITGSSDPAIPPVDLGAFSAARLLPPPDKAHEAQR